MSARDMFIQSRRRFDSKIFREIITIGGWFMGDHSIEKVNFAGLSGLPLPEVVLSPLHMERETG